MGKWKVLEIKYFRTERLGYNSPFSTKEGIRRMIDGSGNSF